MSARRPAARARTAAVTAVLALALPALLAAGCGSPQARAGAGAGIGAASSTAQAVRLSLATSAVSPAGNSQAVIEMGGSAAQHDNFWQLFTRTGSAGQWALATPKGVADNGGLVVADRGARSLVAGFVPSQDLTFSPIATSGNNGGSWSPGPVSGGLASLPDALAAAPDGRLLAILRAGGAELSGPGGTSWKQLADERSLGATPAGRACGLRNITAGAFGASAGPLLAGDCARPGTAGIFTLSDGHWQLAGPVLPAALAARDIDVIRLARTSTGEVALLAADTADGESLLAAWSSGQGRTWTLATPFKMGTSQLRSASLGPAGEVGIVLTAGRGAIIAGPGAPWRRLPALPARTATLAPGPGAQAEALANTSTALSVWRLAPGAAAWNRVQIIKISVPYGSSG